MPHILVRVRTLLELVRCFFDNDIGSRCCAPVGATTDVRHCWHQPLEIHEIDPVGTDCESFPLENHAGLAFDGKGLDRWSSNTGARLHAAVCCAVCNFWFRDHDHWQLRKHGGPWPRTVFQQHPQCHVYSFQMFYWRVYDQSRPSDDVLIGGTTWTCLCIGICDKLHARHYGNLQCHTCSVCGYYHESCERQRCEQCGTVCS
mmetsp:Transcript_10155/g.24377  ORF Transcript_10155/g.24377 Transcript_10155/m.24377 type:complete len:202 (-) Transcript_10155:814-1419(-)